MWCHVFPLVLRPHTTPTVTQVSSGGRSWDLFIGDKSDVGKRGQAMTTSLYSHSCRLYSSLRRQLGRVTSSSKQTTLLPQAKRKAWWVIILPFHRLSLPHLHLPLCTLGAAVQVWLQWFWDISTSLTLRKTQWKLSASTQFALNVTLQYFLVDTVRTTVRCLHDVQIFFPTH